MEYQKMTLLWAGREHVDGMCKARSNKTEKVEVESEIMR